VDRDRARAASGRLIGTALADSRLIGTALADSRLIGTALADSRLIRREPAGQRAADEWPQQFDATWLNGHQKKI
jgi:hypothetical protein